MEKENPPEFFQKKSESLDNFYISPDTTMTDSEIIERIESVSKKIKKEMEIKKLSESDLSEVNYFLDYCSRIIQDKSLNTAESFNDRLKKVIKIFSI